MRAFTLVEVLVTIGIMAIISTIVAVNVIYYRPETRVESVVQEFHSQLLYARNLTISGAVFKDQLGGGPEVPNGYGVYFDNVEPKYWVFGDLYNPLDSDQGNKKYDDPLEKTSLGDVVIDDKIDIQLIDDDQNKTIKLPLHIFFETPNGKMYYYNYYHDDVTGLPGEGENVFDAIQVKFSYKDNPAINQTIVIKRTTNQIYIQE